MKPETKVTLAMGCVGLLLCVFLNTVFVVGSTLLVKWVWGK